MYLLARHRLSCGKYLTIGSQFPQAGWGLMRNDKSEVDN